MCVCMCVCVCVHIIIRSIGFLPFKCSKRTEYSETYLNLMRSVAQFIPLSHCKRVQFCVRLKVCNEKLTTHYDALREANKNLFYTR